ncbi:MAG: right-handed parallel beta-helix repeat-containing protein [Clostridiales bacterium]|nr:right-handed parallel beta-helix repeat-containing protein [Clostridiales bacterium]
MRIHQLSDEVSARIEERAAVLRDEIGRAPSVSARGETYYISADGDDTKDGKTPRTAWRTAKRAEQQGPAAGSLVLFRRGDIFRGGFRALPGVTYSSYGEGDKPLITASPFDGAKTGTWTEVCPSVWRYSEKLKDDCGGIVFDGGTAHGLKKVVNWESGAPVDSVTREPFRGYFDLTGDLSFWHDLGREAIRSEDGGFVYLRSESGDPARRFRRIEFLPRVHGITVGGDNVTVDGLSVMYCGAHGIAAGTVKGLTVRNSVFGWIGGGLQYYRNGRPVRFGNGVEIYGGCADYTVERCHVFQCYDAGLTFQYSSGGRDEILMDGVSFRENLIEDCVYSVEYFLGRPDGEDVSRIMRRIAIEGNVMRRAGYGWGIQRPDKTTPAHIKSWDHENRCGGDFLIGNNVFDRARHMMLHVSAGREEWLPAFRDNTYIQYRGADLGRTGPLPTSMSAYEEDALPAMLGEETFYCV